MLCERLFRGHPARADGPGPELPDRLAEAVEVGQTHRRANVYTLGHLLAPPYHAREPADQHVGDAIALQGGDDAAGVE